MLLRGRQDYLYDEAWGLSERDLSGRPVRVNLSEAPHWNNSRGEEGVSPAQESNVRGVGTRQSTTPVTGPPSTPPPRINIIEAKPNHLYTWYESPIVAIELVALCSNWNTGGCSS